jgi:hypothetical protein
MDYCCNVVDKMSTCTHNALVAVLIVQTRTLNFALRKHEFVTLVGACNACVNR